jgi:hypothetical protein
MSASIAARISTLPIRCLVDQRWGGTRSRFYAWHNPRALEHSLTQSASLEWTLMIAPVRFPLFSEPTRLTGREPFAALGS